MPRHEYTCSECGREKEWEYRSGRRWSRCLVCHPRRVLKNRSAIVERGMSRSRLIQIKYYYKLDKQAFFAIYDNQGGRCAICLDKFKESEAVVDHCHESAYVRGLLCQPCNKGLGHFRDSPDILRKAVDFLESQKSTV